MNSDAGLPGLSWLGSMVPAGELRPAMFAFHVPGTLFLTQPDEAGGITAGADPSRRPYHVVYRITEAS